jgi:F-type H+-transporting ATPase subunit epsilon
VPTQVELVTPERVLFSGEAEFVVLRADGGEIMFLPHHADFVGAVDICVVRIAADGEGDGGEVRAAMAGGFVHVADNTVTVLAGVAELADEIDVPRARRALESAEAGDGGRDADGGESVDAGASTTGTPATGTPATGTATGVEASSDGGSAAEQVVESPTMLALLHPDRPDVRARRALARLEAAGALEGATAPTVAPSH